MASAFGSCRPTSGWPSSSARCCTQRSAAVRRSPMPMSSRSARRVMPPWWCPPTQTTSLPSRPAYPAYGSSSDGRPISERAAAPAVSGSAARSDIGRPSDDDPYAGYAGREGSDVVWVGGHHHGGITRRADRDDMGIGERLTAALRCVQHRADELGQPLVGRHDPNALAISVPSQRSLYTPSPRRPAAHLGKDHRGGLRLTPALGSAAKQRTQSGPCGGVEDVKGTGIEHDRRAHAAPLVLWPRSISFNNRSAAAISAGLGEPCFWSSSSSQRSNASR